MKKHREFLYQKMRILSDFLINNWYLSDYDLTYDWDHYSLYRNWQTLIRDWTFGEVKTRLKRIFKMYDLSFNQ